MTELLEQWLWQTDSRVVSLGIGLFVGSLFGVFAQQSRFCLRAACVEFWRIQPGVKFVCWLAAFGSALTLTQLLIESSYIDTTNIRQLNNAGSMSGAVFGGLMFGAGMVLGRGCASRLLVLSATGNLRALIAGLLVTVVAQASFRGGLAPAREAMSFWWTIAGHLRGWMQWLPSFSGVFLGLAFLGLALWLMRRQSISWGLVLLAGLTGCTVSLAWLLTSQFAASSFDVVSVQSISFTGPSADTLMGLINEPALPLGFDIGLVPGVFLGSFVASVVTGEFKLMGFTEDTGTGRYIVGACLMGFGAMLAGGCAVGAGLSGGSLLLGTAWIALLCMWLGAGLTDWLVDRRGYFGLLR